MQEVGPTLQQEQEEESLVILGHPAGWPPTLGVPKLSTLAVLGPVDTKVAGDGGIALLQFPAVLVENTFLVNTGDLWFVFLTR